MSQKAGGASRRTAVIVLVTAVVLLIGSAVAVPWIARSVARDGTTTTRPYDDRPGNGPLGRRGMMNGLNGSGMMGGSGADGSGMMGGSGLGSGMMGGAGAGMMSGRVWLAGDGVQVTTISAARARATQASSAAGLKPGEIMQFTRNFYVELKDSAGASVTEVLVNPANGAVTGEPGPAMMWASSSRTAAVTADKATAIAASWLAANRAGETVGKIDAYPGYYTVDTMVAGRTAGMLSVNATTGAVWYHTWHGSFVAEEDI